MDREREMKRHEERWIERDRENEREREREEREREREERERESERERQCEKSCLVMARMGVASAG